MGLWKRRYGKRKGQHIGLCQKKGFVWRGVWVEKYKGWGNRDGKRDLIFLVKDGRLFQYLGVVG